MAHITKVPAHVAVIMDGNGRWAQEKGLMRFAGHREGSRRVKEFIKAARDLGIGAVTFFAFSAENWNRPAREVGMIMRYMHDFLGREMKQLHRNNVRFLWVGQESRLPKNILQRIRAAKELTQHNTGLRVILAFNYGARQEIVDAARRVADAVVTGRLKPSELTEEVFAQHLYTAGIPDPDLLIRTSGEMRLSNFLLWQLSYAELYFVKKYWPDFGTEDLVKAVQEFERRERRFGGV